MKRERERGLELVSFLEKTNLRFLLAHFKGIIRSIVPESLSCKAASTAEHEVLAVRLVWISVEVPHLVHLVSSSGSTFQDFFKSRYALSTLFF